VAPDGQRQTKTSGVPLSWLRANFGQCPAEADEATVQRYCRAYVLYIFGSILFPDSGGDMASWMWLPLLADWDEAGTFSWGSAALAWLYRQLCDACRRQGGDANLAGCVWLLQVSSRMLCFITFQFLANMLEANVCDAGLDVDEASSWSAHVEDPSGLAAPGCRPTSLCSSPVGIGPISSSRPQEFGVLPLHKRDGLPTARTCGVDAISGTGSARARTESHVPYRGCVEDPTVPTDLLLCSGVPDVPPRDAAIREASNNPAPFLHEYRPTQVSNFT
jgi:hypothetical protein